MKGRILYYILSQVNEKKLLTLNLEMHLYVKGSVTTVRGEKLSIDNSNFILRGSSLRNTKFAYGIVAFTGY